MSNPEVALTLDDAVAEVLGLLTGLDLTYRPEYDRYRAITRALNRALRANALEQEWSYYTSTLTLPDPVVEGATSVALPEGSRPRVINDDAVRLVDAEGTSVRWAYFLPRDALHKYQSRDGLWVSVTGSQVLFSRPLYSSEAGLSIVLPVMREPVMFALPPPSEDEYSASPPIPDLVRNQEVDFDYPDVIVARAAFYYAQTDPVMQPRVQTLEGEYKDLMYQLIERDTQATDSPYSNEFLLPVQGGLTGPSHGAGHLHPHADNGRR